MELRIENSMKDDCKTTVQYPGAQGNDQMSLAEVCESQLLRASALKSIEYLAAHTSLSVLKRLSEEAKIMGGFEDYDNMDVLSGLAEKTVSTISDNDENSCVSDLSDEPDFNVKAEESVNNFDDSIISSVDPDALAVGDAMRDQYGNRTTLMAVKPQEEQEPAPRSGRARRRNSMASVYSHRYFPCTKTLPYASKHTAALLFVDISGFTKLSTLLDPDSLSRAINSYFQLLVNEVIHHGGDVLKFAGDALFAEWKVSSRHSSSSATDESLETNVRMNLGDCVTAAAICGAKIVAKCCDCPIYEGKSSRGAKQVAALNVHCGISVGDLVSVHVGNSETRREHLVIGKPIAAVAEAEGIADHGEVAACSNAAAALSRTCTLEVTFDGNYPVVIARRSESFFTPPEAYNIRYAGEKYDDRLAKGVSKLVEGWKNSELLRFRKLISLYAHPVVMNNDTAEFDSPRSRDNAQARHLEEAELRNIFVMFISPILSEALYEHVEGNTALFETLNSAMNLTTRELSRFGGHLRQFIMDDKGLVMIATFGLRGSTTANMVSERALPAARSIHAALLSELELPNRIGATLGNAYCGVVGGVRRHEYAVLGPSVNLAARLTFSKSNPGILVDDAVKRILDVEYKFNALPPVEAKGYSELVPVFEPSSKMEQKWGFTKAKFVGRQQELMQLKAIANDVSESGTKSRLVLVSAESGMGKSTLILQALQEIKLSTLKLRKSISITKHANKESDMTTPFSCFGSILLEALQLYDLGFEDRNSLSRGPKPRFSIRSGTSAAASRGQISVNTFNITSRVAERLTRISDKLNAPPEFVEMVGHYILRFELETGFKVDDSKKEAATKLSQPMLIEFMSQTFQISTTDLALLIIDDVHWMDEMSWRVVQRLFETMDNLLIICTTRPLAKYKLAIDSAFWDTLQSKEEYSKRFMHLELGRLDEKDTRRMISMNLGIEEENMSNQLFLNIFVPSSGFPIFVNEICEALKKQLAACAPDEMAACIRSFEESEENGNVYASLDQLILQRIDGLNIAARTILQIAAVFDDVIDLRFSSAVMRQLGNLAGSNETSKQIQNLARQGLEALSDEGVLVAAHGIDYLEGESTLDWSENQDEVETMSFAFEHDIWRRTVLKMCLEDRKASIHRAVALELESQVLGSKDYATRLRLFRHWRWSGDFLKASDLALSIGKSFGALLLNDQCAQIYREALKMYKTASGSEKLLSGYSFTAINSISVEELRAVVKIHTELGNVCTNLGKTSEGVVAYQDALAILKGTTVGADLTDRSIMFPIFSGLFVAIKYGAIKQDDACTYEQSLVAQFVTETRLNGVPVHYLRALAMHAEMFARLGDFKSALETHFKLREAYDVSEHSSEICKMYGSDRAAQSISVSSAWLYQLGQDDDAYETVDLAVDRLLPAMDRRNVHNSFVMLYPVMFLMKERGEAFRALSAFKKYVFEPFAEYFGEGAVTACLSMYVPVMTMLDLCGNEGSDVVNFDEYLSWGLRIYDHHISDGLSIALSNFGGFPDAVLAEISLLLAKRTTNVDDKNTLVEQGYDLGLHTLKREGKRNSFPQAFSVRTVVEALEELRTDE